MLEGNDHIAAALHDIIDSKLPGWQTPFANVPEMTRADERLKGEIIKSRQKILIQPVSPAFLQPFVMPIVFEEILFGSRQNHIFIHGLAA